jgi:SAM-dependent methyltransferase
VREPRLVFGEVPEVYDRARPAYPEQLFDELVVLAGLTAGDRVLDVGAGTGKATVPLARRGLRVTAIEPSTEMARVLRDRVAPFDGVEIVLSDFEDAPIDPGRFAAVVAGQSWPWFEPGVGVTRAAAALRPGGWCAMFFNAPGAPGGAVGEGIAAAYRAHAPLLLDKFVGGRGFGVQPAVDDLESSTAFGSVVRRTYQWTDRRSTADDRALRTTFADHRLLEAARLDRLLDAIAAAIDAAGGVVDRPYDTYLVAASRR